jgi:imidazolonepropionase-like amidohydrolase
MIRTILVLSWLLTSCAGCSAQASTLITNVTVLSPERSAPLAGAWVRIDEGRISELGTGPVESTASTVIDAQGGYLVPGLIDSHVHLYHATGLKRRYTANFDELYDAFMAQQPESFLYFGFTSVVELNADAQTNARFRASPTHPDLVHCGQGIILSDGFMALELEGEPIEQVYPGYLIDHYGAGRIPPGADPEKHTPRAVVEHVRKQGGRCVKLYYEEALWWPGGAPQFRLPSLDIVRDVVQAAHAVQMPVVLHATTPNGHRLALEAGVDVLAHGMWEWPGQDFDDPEPKAEYEELSRQVASSDLRLQPTFSTLRNTASLFDPSVLRDPDWSRVVPQSYMNYLSTDGQRQRSFFIDRFSSALSPDGVAADFASLMSAHVSRYEKLVGGMYGEGAKLLFGSDTAVGAFGWASPPGLAGYWEMQAWIRAGVSLDDLFESLTLGNARAFGLDQEIGTVEVGKRADLLILKANPLDDVRAYNSIQQVVIRGQVINRESLSAQARP